MRSILITLDKTPSCIAAQTLAVALAHKTGATLRGVIATDVSDLEGAEAAPIGRMEQAYDRLLHRRQQAEQRRLIAAQLPGVFQKACEIEGLHCDVTTIESRLEIELLRLIETVDLVVTGRDARFHFEASDGASPIVEISVARGARPVLVTGDVAPSEGPVLVAYDGSVSAARALQLAVLLGMFVGRSAHVVSIRKRVESARKTAMRGAAFLGRHGIESAVEPLELTAEPADLLMERADRMRASLLVMGAFGNRGLREMLFGSCTQRLYDGCPTPLFIHR